MALVNITINGQKLQCQAGQTVLQAARAADIDIPTLCDHPAVTPWGGCRMCLVEIEKQRGLQPACTFPVSEGMVVATRTATRVVAARKFVLELLFSERVHYCMYCAMSGNEETHAVRAADAGLSNTVSTHWRYAPNTAHPWPVDGSRKYFFMDHSRCILCRRCIRACDEIAANHTLGVRERGAQDHGHRRRRRAARRVELRLLRHLSPGLPDRRADRPALAPTWAARASSSARRRPAPPARSAAASTPSTAATSCCGSKASGTRQRRPAVRQGPLRDGRAEAEAGHQPDDQAGRRVGEGDLGRGD